MIEITPEQFAANDARMIEGSFSVPLDGRHFVNYSVSKPKADHLVANSMKHPGFDAVAKSISERQGIPLDHAKAIAAGAARHASRAAVKKNPRLKNVPR
jgi:hypothetical protein